MIKRILVPHLLLNHVGFSRCGVILSNCFGCHKLGHLACLYEETPATSKELINHHVEHANVEEIVKSLL